MSQQTGGKKKGGNAWTQAVAQARKELKITGFVAVKKGTPLYNRAKEIYAAHKPGKAMKKSHSRSKSRRKSKSKSRVVCKVAKRPGSRKQVVCKTVKGKKSRKSKRSASKPKKRKASKGKASRSKKGKASRGKKRSRSRSRQKGYGTSDNTELKQILMQRLYGSAF